MPYAACTGVELPKTISVEFGEPHITMHIECQFVGGARQGHVLASMPWIRDRDPGQRIHLIASCGGKVVPKVIGSLFGKPDSVVRCYQNAHDAVVSTWRCQILENLGARVKDDECVLTHGSEPDPSLVIDGWSHHLVILKR